MRVSFARALGRASVTGVLALALVAGALVTNVAPASAASRYLCTGYSACAAAGFANHGYSGTNGKSYWRMYGGHNCTNYAAYLMIKAGRSSERPWTGNGNANGWGVGMKKITDKTPVVGSIAWWDTGSAGHVAYVEAVVSSTEIIVSEDNWGGDFDWRVITKDSGWPKGFIHFKDSKTDGSVPSWRANNPVAQVWTDSSKTAAATTGTMHPGTTAWITLSVQNTGKEKWTGVQLGAFEKTSRLGFDWDEPGTAPVQSPATVAIGQYASFGFEVQVPADAEDGDVFTQTFAATRPGKGTALPGGKVTVSFRADTRDVFTTQPTPKIAGSVAEGELLTASAGSWKPGAPAISYKWLRNGSTISGATGKTYQLGSADVGRTITVSVSGKAEGFIPASKKSSATDVVTSKYSPSLALGASLVNGKQFVSTNGRYRLLQKNGGSLYVQDRFTSKTVWHTSSKKKIVRTLLKPTGSLVGYDKKGKIVWTSGTSGKGVTRATVTSGGRLALYTASGKVVWSSVDH